MPSYRLLILALGLSLLWNCSYGGSLGAEKPPNQSSAATGMGGTIELKELTLTGSARAGQYTDHLKLLTSVLSATFTEKTDWRLLTDALVGTTDYAATKPPHGTASHKADYLLIGQMDGFFLEVVRAGRIVKIVTNGVQRETAATVGNRLWEARSKLSVTLVDTKSRVQVLSKTIDYVDVLKDSGNAETLVNTVLSRISDRLVSEIMMRLSKGVSVQKVIGSERLLLDQGFKQGLRRGMAFNVYRPDEKSVLTAYRNDEAIGRSLVAKAQLDEVDEYSSYAVLTGYAGGSSVVKPGDVLRLDENFLLDREQKQEGRKRIRIAFGGAEWPTQVGNQLSTDETAYMASEIEHSLSVLLAADPAFDLVDENSRHVKNILMQQQLTALNMGRSLELEKKMGDIRGVDYLVYVSLSRAVWLPGGDSVKNIEMTGEKIRTEIPDRASMSGYLYLQQVDTSDTVARVEVDVEQVFTKDSDRSSQIIQLARAFARKSFAAALGRLRPLEVIQVSNGGKVFLNGGRSIGLQVGQILRVLSQGEIITDPYTGAVLDDVGGSNKAEIQIIEITPRDFAVAVRVSGDQPEVGDAVVTISDVVSNLDTTNTRVKPAETPADLEPSTKKEIYW